MYNFIDKNEIENNISEKQLAVLINTFTLITIYTMRKTIATIGSTVRNKLEIHAAVCEDRSHY